MKHGDRGAGKMKTARQKRVVYSTMSSDLFHRGHLELIKKAKAQGDFLIIGLHPDDVIRQYKRQPIMPFEDRKAILESIKGVDMVVEDCMNYRKPNMIDNLKKHKVDVLVHGDDWMPPLYEKAKSMGYKVVQVPYHAGVSTTKLLQKIKGNGFVRKSNNIIVSAGDAITAKLIENAGFDGIWVSGFEASARLGLADNGTITMTEMLNVTKPIVEAVSIPVLVDVDNGYGSIHNFVRCVKEFEKAGACGVCVEDNVFPKQNSLWGGKVPLMSKEEHGAKIKAGKNHQRTDDFMIIARTEALVRGYGMEEAIKRAEYYTKCGADAILIHSREASGKEAMQIPKHWKLDAPLAIVPTKFPHVTSGALFKAGYSMVILANQTERVKIKSIKDALASIKRHDNVMCIEKGLSATLDDMRDLTPIAEAERIERTYGHKKI